MTHRQPHIQTNSFKAWCIAARPKTLSGAAVPVMIGLAHAYADTAGMNAFQWLPAVLCMLFAFVMQINANFINDFFDFKKGIDDTSQRLGPRRACAQQWITLHAMKHAIASVTCLACLLGLPLVFYGGLFMLLVGALCVLFCFLYTTHLSGKGLGDVLVLVFFGIVPVCATYYIQCQQLTWQVFLSSIACGMVIDTLLVVNNYRDRFTDLTHQKMTLVIRIGEKRARLLYLYLGVVACTLGVIHCFHGQPLAFVLPLLYLLMHTFTYLHILRIDKGKALNKCLGQTARNMFIYGLLLSIALIL
ncbi:MAG: 1,4-dihydroxy-2-naphthoate octaprenyltransferase [Prevotella sp.]